MLALRAWSVVPTHEDVGTSCFDGALGNIYNTPKTFLVHSFYISLDKWLYLVEPYPPYNIV